MKKKVFMGLVGLMGLMGCVDGGMKYGKGGENAIQFVKEQVPGLPVWKSLKRIPC